MEPDFPENCKHCKLPVQSTCTTVRKRIHHSVGWWYLDVDHQYSRWKRNLRSSSQPQKHLRGCSPKTSLRNRSKSRVSICVNINLDLDSFQQSISLLLWGSHYRVTIFSQPFTSTVINHAPFNYWFVIYSLNPFQILLLIFTSFFNPILCLTNYTP